MGLDMYLSKRTYLDAERREAMGLDERMSYLVQVIGYWRKANAIHRWFVEQVQGGTDDCRAYQVTREQLHELLDRVEQVLVRPELAPTLLPTEEGFFFGTTRYDESYWADMEETQRIVREALSDERVSSFEYCASW
jgi:hypothetical protein